MWVFYFVMMSNEYCNMHNTKTHCQIIIKFNENTTRIIFIFIDVINVDTVFCIQNYIIKINNDKFDAYKYIFMTATPVKLYTIQRYMVILCMNIHLRMELVIE